MEMMTGIRKRLKFFVIAGFVFLAGFGMNRLEAHAVGIYVDEEAAGSGDKAADAKPGAKDAADSGQEEMGDAKEDMGITPVAGANPAAEWLWKVGTGEKGMYDAMMERKLTFIGDSAPTALDISNGSIVLSKEGAYTQKGTGTDAAGTVSSQRFTIGGTTTANADTPGYHITVEPGAAPTIQASSLSINLGEAEGISSGSGLYIKSGAAVTLVLGPQETNLSGSKLFAGITLEPGATLKISGEGRLNVIGGALAFGISGPSNEKGGSFWIGDKADLRSYSDQIGGALSADISAVSKKILQGTLYSAASQDPSVLIKAENRDKPTESIEINLPQKYRSFAASTTLEGGSYVSYYPGTDGGIQNSQLLVNADSPTRHSYDLEGTGNTFAALENLVSRRVEYKLTFHANGGLFGVNNSDRHQINAGYGETITLPADTDVTRTDYTLRGWYRIMDSIKDEDKWNELTDRAVRDNTILYATWKPNKCKVQYRSNNAVIPGADHIYNYEDTVPFADSWKPGPDAKPGFSLAYWKGPDGEKWVFDGHGTKLLRKTTILDAVWLADCTVTYDPNAGSEKLDGWPITEKTQATSLITKPSRTLERQAFSFTGKWYKDKACTKEWDFAADTVTKNITLYAGWGAKVTKVYFKVDGNAGEVVTPPDIDVEFGHQIPKPEASKAGRVELPTEYTVEGWYTDDGKKWDFTKGLIDADGIFNLTPKWEQTVYWATLRPGDKEAAPQEAQAKNVPNGNSLSTQYGEGLNNVFEKQGHKITGWKNKKNGKTWDMNAPLTEDITLTAMWEPNTYTMSFITPEGAPSMPEGQGSKTVVYNRTTEAPKYGTGGTAWPGHTFQGWYTDSEPEAGKLWKFSGEAGADAMPPNDVTLYAYWTRDEYRVSFHTYTGDKEENKIPDQYPLYYGDSVTKPQDPPRAHYDFLGWYKDKEMKDQLNFTKDTVTSDMMLYAGWKAHPIQVVLHVKYEPENKDHPNEAVDIAFTKEVYYGDYLDQAALESLGQTSARPGYTLNGWYTDEGYAQDGKWDFPNNKAEPESERLDLYAYWTWDEYTVNFQTWDGDSQIPPTAGVRYGQKIAKPNPAPTRTHYTFDDWYVDLKADPKVPWNFDKDTVTGSMSLYANWLPDTYTLSFETNGGTGLDPIQVVYGNHVPPNALQTTREGYSLAGWYRDRALTQPFAPGTDYVDGNMTIYAGWELQRYTVTYHYRQSKDSPKEENISYKNTYHTGDYLAQPDKKVPHKTLSSWYKSPTWNKEDKWMFKRDQVEGDTDLYAYWSDTMYNVHFETSGGTPIEDTSLPWGSQLEQPKDPEKPGSIFDGWYKDEEYQTPWSFEEDFVDGDTNLYAKWITTMCSVTFNTDEGLPVPDLQVLPYGSLITEPEAPEKEGYNFVGWKAEGAKDNWDFASSIVKGDTVLTAQWVDPNADPANPQDPANPGDPGTPGDQANPNGQSVNAQNGGNGNGNNGGNDPAAAKNGDGAGNGTAAKGTDAKGTAQDGGNAKQALTDAANELKKILTGDKAPLTYLIMGIFLSAAIIIGVIRKKYK